MPREICFFSVDPGWWLFLNATVFLLGGCMWYTLMESFSKNLERRMGYVYIYVYVAIIYVYKKKDVNVLLWIRWLLWNKGALFPPFFVLSEEWWEWSVVFGVCRGWMSKNMSRVGFKIILFLKWMFPKIMVPQNGWFIRENPIKMDDLGVSLFLETSKWIYKHWITIDGRKKLHHLAYT